MKEIYDEFEHLSFFCLHEFYSPFHILSHSMSGFVDYRNNMSNLNDPAFAALLQDWQQVFNGQGLFDFGDMRRIVMRRLHSITNLGLRGTRYVFSIEEYDRTPANALIPHSNPYFTHYIPITDEQGRLRLSQTRLATANGRTAANISGSGHIIVPLISAAADGAVAWKYVQHLVSAFVNMQKPRYCQIAGHKILCMRTLVTPIRRDYFIPHVARVLYCAVPERPEVFWCARRPRFTADERIQAIETAIGRLATYNEMPVTPPFMIPNGLFEDLLDTFLRTPSGIFGAQQTAQELHNRVSLWLIE